MRIYGVADLHARPDRMDRVRRNIDEYRPDVLVIAGDMTSYRHPAAVLEKLQVLPVPVLAVRGNTDLGRMEKLFDAYSNIVSLHLNRVQVADTSFSGVSGTLPVPFRSRIGLWQRKVMQQAKALVDRESVFVTHPPPYGTLDRVMGRFHAGARAVSALIAERAPRLVLCGHIHEDYGHAVIGRTHVVNCNVAGSRQGVLVDMEKGEDPVIRLLGEGQGAG